MINDAPSHPYSGPRSEYSGRWSAFDTDMGSTTSNPGGGRLPSAHARTFREECEREHAPRVRDGRALPLAALAQQARALILPLIQASHAMCSKGRLTPCIN